MTTLPLTCPRLSDLPLSLSIRMQHLIYHIHVPYPIHFIFFTSFLGDLNDSMMQMMENTDVQELLMSALDPDSLGYDEMLANGLNYLSQTSQLMDNSASTDYKPVVELSSPVADLIGVDDGSMAVDDNTASLEWIMDATPVSYL